MIVLFFGDFPNLHFNLLCLTVSANVYVAKRRARRKPAEARHARRRNSEEEECCCVDCDVIVELGQGGDTLDSFSVTEIEIV